MYLTIAIPLKLSKMHMSYVVISKRGIFQLSKYVRVALKYYRRRDINLQTLHSLPEFRKEQELAWKG